MKNKIFNGNCLEILKTFPDNFFHLVITSPPYSNLKHYSDLEGDIGNLDIYQQIPILEEVFKQIIRVLQPGRKFILFFCDIPVKKDKQTFIESPTYLLVPKILNLGSKIKNIFIWRKPGSFSSWGHSGSLPYPPSPVIQSYFEYIFVFQKDGKPNYSHISKENRERSSIPVKDIMKFSGVLEYSNSRNLKKIHPAIFPVELIRNLIMLYSFVGENVLDPFGGIGTVGVACKQLERNYTLIEINSKYVEIAQERIEKEKSIVNKILKRVKELKQSKKEI
jgi:DNA modification methylase